jgi:hypothetical protein
MLGKFAILAALVTSCFHGFVLQFVSMCGITIIKLYIFQILDRKFYRLWLVSAPRSARNPPWARVPAPTVVPAPPSCRSLVCSPSRMYFPPLPQVRVSVNNGLMQLQ